MNHLLIYSIVYLVLMSLAIYGTNLLSILTVPIRQIVQVVIVIITIIALMDLWGFHI